MRCNRILRAAVLGGAAAVAMAGTTVPARAQTQADTSASISIADRHLRAGQSLDVRGRLRTAALSVALEFRPRGGRWQAVARARARPDRSYRMRAALRRSGSVRVVARPAPGTATSAGTAVRSRVRGVAVAAKLRVGARRRGSAAGASPRVAGTLAPGGARRRVALQQRLGGAWRTVARDRTDARGRFVLRPRRAARGVVRVLFAGDAANGPARRTVGRLERYRRANASWYGPGLYGNRLGCGGRLGTGTLGVAHKSLPCGTRVTLRHQGRTVRVAVIDRGPYVGGREFDLTAATARALGFSGHGPVQVSH